MATRTGRAARSSNTPGPALPTINAGEAATGKRALTGEEADAGADFAPSGSSRERVQASAPSPQQANRNQARLRRDLIDQPLAHPDPQPTLQA